MKQSPFDHDAIERWFAVGGSTINNIMECVTSDIFARTSQTAPSANTQNTNKKPDANDNIDHRHHGR
jgi:hypothetical protein